MKACKFETSHPNALPVTRMLQDRVFAGEGGWALQPRV